MEISEGDKFVLAKTEEAISKIDAKIDKLHDAFDEFIEKNNNNMTGMKVSAARVTVVISLITSLATAGMVTAIRNHLEQKAITPQYYTERKNGQRDKHN